MRDDLRRVPVKPTSVNAETWAPFGFLPVDEREPVDNAKLEFLWADPHLNIIGHTYDEIERIDGTAICDHLNRHDTHTQALMPLNGDGFVVVAPAAVGFTSEADLEKIRVFVLPRYACVILARGTWHWGPYPVEPGRLELLNVQGKRFAEDNGVASLPDLLGVVVEAILPSSS